MVMDTKNNIPIMIDSNNWPDKKLVNVLLVKFPM